MAKFRAKARAVELLGKGQIADLPTAISELWKNGYDAYATKLECKLFLDSYKDNKSPIFILSDNGFGMSEEDILNKWFVLGTDSKARNEKLKPEFGLKRRVPMGEKGIGRLSVSYLGSQMIMLTKKENQIANAFLMDWRVLENYNFYLDDLNIPLFNFSTSKEFKNKFRNAKADFLENLNDIDSNIWDEQVELKKSIQDDLKSLIIPNFINEEVIEKFCNLENHGTLFVVFTPNEQLLDFSNKDYIRFKNNSSLIYLRSSLSGLHNDLKNPEKDFNTNFLILDASGKYDLIEDFFTTEEMKNTDHWLKGDFDENGFFSGEIKIFNRREKYTFKPNRPPGKTPYGPFKIEWGAPEGSRTSSMLNEEEYHNLDKKLDLYGGLYIYRDNFRVLPYGRTESDFLEFEKRRTLHAGLYFFSHRRFIGYIDLKRDQNSNLKDKAGREGFIQNKAYREFKDDLIEFFIDIAKRYMRSSKEKKFDTFRENQIFEIEAKHNKQLEEAKKKNKRTKKAFLAQLKENLEDLELLNNDIDELSKQLDNEVSKLEINYNSYNKVLEKLETKKVELRSLKILKPQGIKVTSRQEDDYMTYQQKYYKVDTTVQMCVKVVNKTRERISTENLKLEYNEKYRRHIKYLEKQFLKYQDVSKLSYARIEKLLKDEKEIQIEAFTSQSSDYSIQDNDKNEGIRKKISLLENLINEQNET
ncbi:MAG: ATP-binding protein, partial [Candidatus Delongbacteria bacterium]|nr:ATP-binding protein [Candidatus Delongbacteria bacterium]